MQQLPEPTVGDHGTAVRRARAVVVALPAAEVAALVDGYRAGASVKDLATRFGIHRTTVAQHLHRSGVPMRTRGLDDGDVDHAVRLYQRGHSPARTGAQLGVHAETARRALRARGVVMRKTWERG